MPAVEAKGYKRIKVAHYHLKYKDVFNLEKFYEDLHDWLNEHEWADLEDGGDHYETLYLEKIDIGGLKEIWIKWRPQKIPEKNSYYRCWLDFDMHCIGFKDVEVVKEGKKLKAHKGEMMLDVTAFMDLDYQGEWSSHPILRFFNKIFPERIFRKELFDDHKNELYREAYELQNFMKHWFKFKTFAPYEEKTSFFPSYAWPSHLKE